MREDKDLQIEAAKLECEATSIDQECSAEQLPLLTSPSRRMMKMAQWFRIGLSIFLILSVVFGMMGCASQSAKTPWRSAIDVLPRELLTEIVKQQSSGLPNPEKVVDDSLRVFLVPGQEGQVAIFDFDHSGWCGLRGCYYPIYWLRDKQHPPQLVFSALLYPRLPADKPLFEKGEENSQPLPCLSVWQAENTEMSRLRQVSYCFNGTQYQPVKSSIIDTRQALSQ